MDPSALAGLCALIARGQAVSTLAAGVKCPPAAMATQTPSSVLNGEDLARRLAAPRAREGIGRVAFAEAANQGDSGMAGVVYTFLNRLADRRWGGTVDGVLNAPGQFEPVLRVGGDWRALPPISATAQARINTIINLALDGRLPDLTHGARFFQNPVIVAARARHGQVSAGLVNFGGATPSAVIGDHRFFAAPERGGGFRGKRATSARTADEARLFVDPPANDEAAPQGPPRPPAGDPSRALFVTAAGQVRADRR